jgi:hypothetical protein
MKNIFKSIRRKSFYRENQINDIDFSKAKAEGQGIFAKIHKKIKWQNINYDELSAKTIKGIDWSLVDFKKASRSASFAAKYIDKSEARRSPTYSRITGSTSTGSDPITGKRFIALGEYDTWGLLARFDSDGKAYNNEAYRNIGGGPREFFNLKIEFNDDYLIFSGTPTPGRTILKGSFSYNSNGKLTKGIVNEFVQVNGDIAKTGSSSYGIYGKLKSPENLKSINPEEPLVDPSGAIRYTTIAEYNYDGGYISGSSETYKSIVNAFNKGAFFPKGWALQTIDQIDVLK